MKLEGPLAEDFPEFNPIVFPIWQHDRFTNLDWSKSFLANRLGLFKEFIFPTLNVHIFRGFWSTLTGLLKEFCMPWWRWQVAYLAPEDTTPRQRILVCVQDLSKDQLKALKNYNREISLISFLEEAGFYKEFSYEECILVDSSTNTQKTYMHPLGSWFEHGWVTLAKKEAITIYRPRDFFSTLKYYVLKQSPYWQEITLEHKNKKETVLVKTSDINKLRDAGFIANC